MNSVTMVTETAEIVHREYWPCRAGQTADTPCHLQLICDKIHWRGQGNEQILSNLDTTCQLVADFQIVLMLFIATGVNSG